jgi:hypothetical protein
MFAVMGITGNVGGAVANTLLEHGKRVRGIVRNDSKAEAWKDKGVEVVTAKYDDHLAAAFTRVEGVFLHDSARCGSRPPRVSGQRRPDCCDQEGRSRRQASPSRLPFLHWRRKDFRPGCGYHGSSARGGSRQHRSAERVPSRRIVPRETWVDTLAQHGMPADRSGAYIEMTDSFNSRWIDFGVPGTEHVKGTIDLVTAVKSLTRRAS